MVAIIRTNPNRSSAVEPVFGSEFEEVEELLSDFEPDAFVDTESLPLDMWEQGDDLVLKVEVPGVKREDIDVSLQGDCLTITADNKEKALPEKATSYICERCYGQMSRSVQLPYPIDTEKIFTRLENGLLEIRLPKAEEAKAKHIEVKARA